MTEMLNKKLYNSLTVVLVALILVGCTASGDNQGLEYAPQMYHSTPYEPLSQIKDTEAGRAITSSELEEHAEFYNSNPYNDFGMTMREPVANTVKRGDYLPNHIDPLDYETAEATLVNPLDSSSVVIGEGKILYERFCDHCHGASGSGDGSVGQVFKGVTSYTSASVVDKKEGHIFHVITHGKGRMGAHASQISVEDRWKIVRYVQTLQNQ